MERKWWHDKVAYQIYPKSFLDTNGDGIGDLRGIISKLDYLKSLGIDIIWLSPIYKSPFVDQGYDISDYYAIAEEFGTMEEFDELLAEAKKRDMHIIMDLVINHCSDKHEWFQKALKDPDGEYADYFYFRKGKNGNPPSNYRSYFGGSCWEKVPGTDKYYLHMFAKEQPDLNWENEKLRQKLYEMINWWLDKGLSGFRIDAIINIKKNLDFPDFEPDAEDGGCFFYPNPLSSDGKYKFNADGTTTRQPWFGCACCPSNLSRFIPSLPGYLYGVKNKDIYVNLFAGNTSSIQVMGKEVVLEETTEYPWNGDIRIVVKKSGVKGANLLVRIPGWVRNQVVPSDLYKYSDAEQPAYSVSVNGKAVEADLAANKGYLPVKNIRKGDVIRIHFDMPVRTVVANGKVADDRGKVAVERGPLVYCAEAVDNDGAPVLRSVVAKNPAFSVIDGYSISNTETKGAPAFSVKAIQTAAQVLGQAADGKVSVKNQKLTLIPYYAWNHRGANQMNVWFYQDLQALEK